MKSNKKLFAILTLVMFMMTLVPMAAFGADGTFNGANKNATVVSTDKTGTTADGTATVKFTTYVYDAQYDLAGAGVSVYFASKRASTDTFAAVTGGSAVTQVGATNVYTATTDANGKVEFTVKSSIPGTAGIAVGLLPGTANTTDLYAYITGVAGATVDSCGYVTTKDIAFSAPSIDAVAISGTPVASDAGVVTGAGTSANPWQVAAGTLNGNGVDTYEIAFKVSANSSPVTNQEVTFAVNKSEAVLNKTTATTDATGIVKVKVNATKPGDYYVKATSGDFSSTQYVRFAGNQAYDIALISTNNQTVAKSNSFTLKFQLKDSSGNQVDASIASGATGSTIATDNGGLLIETTTKPTDAAMDAKITDSTIAADYTFSVTTEKYLQMVIGAAEMATEGDYVIKAYLPNGKAVAVNFKVQKQGTITKITVAYDQAAVPLGTTVGKPTVKRWDANNVSSTVDLTTNVISFTTSDIRMYSNAVVLGKNFSDEGSFVSATDKNYAGEFTVTAIDEGKNLTATTTISVAKQANGFTLTPAEATTAVGTDAVVNAQWVDVDGKSLSVSDATAIDYTFYTVSKPSGALITTSEPTTKLADINKYGKAALKISSNVAGEVKIQVVGTITGGTSVGTYSKEVTLNFGAAKAAIGAKAVTMFIGATGFVQDGAAKVNDVAPFIQDGRTFVAVRPIADAFGAEIGWNEATQTVTLTRTDMTLTIVIGSTTITKVAGGVTTTSVADVAAFIKDGRTVLPFRAVGEAFGATVSYDAATQAVSFTQ